MNLPIDMSVRHAADLQRRRARKGCTSGARSSRPSCSMSSCSLQHSAAPHSLPDSASTNLQVHSTSLNQQFKCITKALYLHAYTSSNAMQEICCPLVCLCHIPSLRHHWDAVTVCVHAQTDSFFPMLRSVQLIGTPCGVIHLKEAICMSGNGCLRKPSRLPAGAAEAENTASRKQASACADRCNDPLTSAGG